MKLIIDSCCLLAVALNEPEKSWLLDVTDGFDLVAPAVLPYEIGKALSAQVRRRRITPTELVAAWDAIAAIPIDLVTIDCRSAAALAGHQSMYAYDAYFLQCAIEKQYPLLTLDRDLQRMAERVRVPIVEGP